MTILLSLPRSTSTPRSITATWTQMAPSVSWISWTKLGFLRWFLLLISVCVRPFLKAFFSHWGHRGFTFRLHLWKFCHISRVFGLPLCICTVGTRWTKWHKSFESTSRSGYPERFMESFAECLQMFGIHPCLDGGSQPRRCDETMDCRTLAKHSVTADSMPISMSFCDPTDPGTHLGA